MESHILDVLADRVLELGPKPAAGRLYRHFKLTRGADGVAWLLFDRQGAGANTLSADVLAEFDTVLAALESERPTGLVIRSAKTSGFIAGADVNEFRGATDARAVEAVIGHFRNALTKAGIPASLPIRITENGWPTSPSRSPQRQAEVLEAIVRAIHGLRERLNVTHYEFFALRDAVSEAPDALTEWGLLRADYSPKPAFETYRRLIAELGESAPKLA
jgi:hypothetical protein